MADQSDWAVRLIDRVTGPAKKMKGAIGSLEESFKAAGKGVRSKAADGFVAGIGKIKEGMIITGAVAGGVAAALVGATVKTADFAQTAMLGFKAVAKHGASAEKLFAHSRLLAEDLGLDVMDTSKAFTKLLALQFNPQMATDLIKMGADMRALGTTSEGVQNILAQLGQVQAKGRLQGEELTVLAENGLSTQLVYKKLSEQLGKTKDEILKMQQAGDLTSDMAFPAIMAAVMEKTGEKKLGDVGKQIADQTMSGMAGRMLAQAQNLWIDIGREATPALMSTFKALQREFGEVLGSKSMKEGIVNTVETVAGLVRSAIPFVKQFTASFADGFKTAFPAIQGAVGILFDGFGDGATWMDNTRDFADTLGKIAAFGVGVVEVFAGMAAAGTAVSPVIEGLIFLWDGLINGIGAVAFAIDDFLMNLGAKWRAFSFADLATSMIDGLVNGITGGVSRVVDAVVNLGKSAKEAFANILDSHSPSRVFEQFGLWSGEGYAIGLENSFDGMGGQFDSLANASAPDLSGGGAGSGRGGATLNIENVNIDARGTADPYQAGRAAAAGFEEELSSIFERWTMAAA